MKGGKFSPGRERGVEKLKSGKLLARKNCSIGNVAKGTHGMHARKCGRGRL